MLNTLFLARLQFSRIIVALALLAGASAFAPATRLARGSALSANIVDTLKTLEGPNIYWGSAGVLEGHDESEVKGKDTFNTLIAAIEAAGLKDTLSGGEFTLFAPTDSAFADLPPGTVEGLLKDPAALAKILTYHAVEGKVTKDSIGGNLKTVNGAELTYKRFARQTFVDMAVVGQVPQGAATGSVFPTDVACDNGLVHVIDQVLTPGWTATGAEAGLGGVA